MALRDDDVTRVPDRPAAADEDGDGAPTPGPAPGFSGIERLAVRSIDIGDAPPASTLVFGGRLGDPVEALGQRTVTFSFADTGSAYPAAPAGDRFLATLQPLPEPDRALVRAALESIAAVCNLRFVEVADAGTTPGALRYAYSQAPTAMGFAGYGFYPAVSPRGGEVWLATAQSTSEWAFYRPALILHETLHALGLLHAAATVPAASKLLPNTVMSYSTLPGTSGGLLEFYPAEPMPADIAALQLLYGPARANEGDTTYDLAAVTWRTGFHAIWDSGGVDALDARGLAGTVQLDLQPGARSDIGVQVLATGRSPTDGSMLLGSYHATLAVASGAWLENAYGSAGADVLQGNELANRLWGGPGNDTLTGAGGADWLEPGPGNDSLDGGEGLDTAVFDMPLADAVVSRAGPITTVGSGIRGEVVTLAGVERLQFTGGGLAFDVPGHAGMAARLVGVLAGPQAVHDPALVGAVLAALDAGVQADRVALHLAGDPAGLVQRLYANVTGAAAPPDVAQAYEAQLARGDWTPAGLILMAAGTDLLAARIDLVGLQATGIAYALA